MHNIRCFLMLFFLFLTGCDTSLQSQSQECVKCELINVIDGDTLSVVYDSAITKVRLIGIDTPESVHPDEELNNQYGDKASEYTQELLADIKYVYLEFDESMYDEYDRLLAYVYLSDNQAFEESINFILVSNGYALNKEFAPNTRYAAELEAAFEDAKTNEKGLWQLQGIENVFGK